MSGDTFNNPFSGLKQEVKERRQASTPASAAQKPEKPVPVQLPRDFTDDDEAASAMFLATVGKTQPAKIAAPDDGMRSMADLLAAQPSAGKEGNEPAPKASVPKPGKKAAALPPRVEELPEVGISDDEALSFARAMRGVTPVDESRGRALAPPAPQSPIRHKSAERDYLAEFTGGKYEFALEYTEEFFEGHVKGLDPLVIAKMRAGQYSPETHIDLHGMNSEQAHAELVAFIKGAYINGRRQLVVVTGRGKNSPGGLSVLRQNMQEWLTREPLRRVVLAFSTAQPKDGGAGAIYVLLRKYKKNQGKVRWDITPPGI